MSQTLDPTKYFVRKSNIASEILDDELVILDGVRDAFVLSNAVGAYIWTKLQQPVTVVSFRDGVLEAFLHADPTIVEPDLVEFLNELLEKQLVEIADVSDEG